MARNHRTPIRRPVGPGGYRSAQQEQQPEQQPASPSGVVGFRPATGSDDARLDELRLELLPYTAKYDLDARTARRCAREDPDTHFLVATIDQSLAGCLYTHLAVDRGLPNVLLMKWLLVAPQFQRRGIGTSLIGEVRGLLPAGALWFGGCAETEVDFYARAGFEVLAAGTHLESPLLPMPMVNTNPDAPHWFSQVV